MISRSGIAQSIIALALAASAGECGSAGVVVIGNQNLSNVDAATLQKIYTGKVIQVNGVAITAVHLTSGSALRNRFLQSYLHEDEEQYVAYWITRRYSGQGAPPRELSSSNAIITYVRNTPGAIGYIDEAEVEPGLNVLIKP